MRTPLALGQPSDSSGLLPEITEDNRVDARSLHEALEIATPFHKWFSRRIEEYQFKEGDDYQRTNLSAHREDYHLTLDTAKELAMVERNEAGRRVRRYFIDVEKRARTAYEQSRQSAGLGTGTLAKLQQINSGLIQALGEHEERLGHLETTARPGLDWGTVPGWLADRGITATPGRMSYLSKKCLEHSARRGLPVGLGRSGSKGGHPCRTYAPEVLAHVLPVYLTRWEARDNREGQSHE